MKAQILKGRTERERGRTFQIERVTLGSSTYTEGAQISISCMGGYPEDGYRRESITLTMGLDEARDLAARISEMVRRMA